MLWSVSKMNLDKVRQALALKSIEGIGNVVYERLTSRFGLPSNVFQQGIENLKMVAGISRELAERIAAFKDWERIDREIETAHSLGVNILTTDDPSYPELLFNIHDRPALIYVMGKLIPDEACIAVVGSRMASTYGKFTAEKFSRELAQHGLAIVSGLARGIDTAAHKGALSAKGRTVAVLGSGLDVIYPLENRKLFNQIAETGAVISEFSFQTQPLASNFPYRNRIISGMSLGTLVMEAAENSGSLITARCALDQGREVFAVPGSIDYPGSRGTHRLIKEGAKLVENISDILEEIAPRLKRETPGPPEQCFSGRPSVDDRTHDTEPAIGLFNDIEIAIMDALSRKPSQIDEIIDRTGFASSDILDRLLVLELKGHVEQLPGKLFRKTGPMTIE